MKHEAYKGNNYRRNRNGMLQFVSPNILIFLLQASISTSHYESWLLYLSTHHNIRMSTIDLTR